MTEHLFSAEVRATGRSGHAVEVPKELAAGLAGRRTSVLTHIDGVECRARVGAYGGKVYLWLRQDLLRRVDRRAGDTVEVRIVAEAEPEVEAPAEVTEPPELTAALAEDEAARTAYAALPPEHRREYWAWIGGAEQPEVRADRVARTLRRLRR